MEKTSFVNGEPKPIIEQAFEIQERWINEIEEKGFLEMMENFISSDIHAKKRVEGDPLLYK